MEEMIRKSQELDAKLRKLEIKHRIESSEMQIRHKAEADKLTSEINKISIEILKEQSKQLG